MIIIMCMPLCFKWEIFVKNGKFRMKCVEKYDAQDFLDELIDHRNLL